MVYASPGQELEIRCILRILKTSRGFIHNCKPITSIVAGVVRKEVVENNNFKHFQEQN